MKKITKTSCMLWWFCFGGWIGISTVWTILIRAMIESGYTPTGSLRMMILIAMLIGHYYGFKKFSTAPETKGEDDE
jgi:hypothetical protein